MTWPVGAVSNWIRTPLTPLSIQVTRNGVTQGNTLFARMGISSEWTTGSPQDVFMSPISVTDTMGNSWDLVGIGYPNFENSPTPPNAPGGDAAVALWRCIANASGNVTVTLDWSSWARTSRFGIVPLVILAEGPPTGTLLSPVLTTMTSQGPNPPGNEVHFSFSALPAGATLVFTACDVDSWNNAGNNNSPPFGFDDVAFETVFEGYGGNGGSGNNVQTDGSTGVGKTDGLWVRPNPSAGAYTVQVTAGNDQHVADSRVAMLMAAFGPASGSPSLLRHNALVYGG